MRKVAVFWFRRDLRLADNAGLYHALKSGHEILPLFIFDKQILDKLPKKDARVEFIHDTLNELSAQLAELGSSLVVKHGSPEEIWQELMHEYDIQAVYTNRDYEPYAKRRDAVIGESLGAKSIPFHKYKDHIVFEKEEVQKADGTPYTVFTPYKRKWLAKLQERLEDVNGEEMPLSFYFKAYPTEKYFKAFAQMQPLSIMSLSKLGFEPTSLEMPSTAVAQGAIRNYDKTRDFPALAGTSKLGLHFRFGTISIRDKARKAEKLNDTYLSELVWRDFYATILDSFPHVIGNPFRAKYAFIPWRNNEAEFQKWCDGQTGYPIVDAGMRELNTTGYMHNRVRMIVASFLTKHLLIDWQWGEQYFAEKLLDFDLASNNGGWQWAAGCGTDAAPYFRIFNPYTQQVKFDKEFKYIKKWVPEYGTDDYVGPVVDHKEARLRCLAAYKEGLALADLELK